MRQFFLACRQRSLCVHDSFEPCTLLGGAVCVAHRALLNVEFVRNCELAARIDLRGLRWNACQMRLTFYSDVRVFPDFTLKRLPVVLSLLSQNRILFRRGG
jgi:hypothetical protein